MQKQKGFTLIELLIVIAIIAIVAGVVFVALDPLKRFQNARDSRRAADAASLLSAIKVSQIDNGGSYINEITNMTAGNIYMIGTYPGGLLCMSKNSNCDTAVTAVDSCVDLTPLVTAGLIGSIPISPNGAGSWDAAYTGYTLQRSSSGVLTARACESENTSEISLSR
jgi:type IV pilus assembly protein PilA